MLAVATLAPLGVAAPSTAQNARRYSFNDIQNHWAIACIEGIGSEALMKGYPNGSFRPNGTMTRAEFAAVMVKAFPNAPKVREAANFSDVPSDFWGKGAIAAAYERGFLTGYPDNIFQPNQAISRAQAIVVMAKAQRLLPIINISAVLDHFIDASQIPRYAEGDIASATQQGLVVAYPRQNELRPSDSITRGEATALLCRTNRAGTDARYYVPNQFIADAGTPPLLSMLREFPQAFPTPINQKTVLGDRLFFGGATSDGTAALWETDGTPPGTRLVKTIALESGGRRLQATDLSIVLTTNSRLWFQTDQTFRRDDRPDSLQLGIWSSDGTVAGTQAITSLSPELSQALTTASYWLLARNNLNLFEKYPLIVDTPGGAQIWLTDGATAAGTQRLANFPHAYDSSGQQLGFVPDTFIEMKNAAENYLIFIAGTEGSTDLWRTDGTSAGTTLFNSISTDSYFPSSFTPARDRAYFTIDTPELGEELWVTEGTKSSTTVLKDIYPGEQGATARMLTNVGETYLFLANSDEGMELWATEGSPASTRRVKRLSTDVEFDGSLIYTAYDNKVFFATPTTETDKLTQAPSTNPLFDLWVSDGTQAGTQRLGLALSNYFASFTPYKGRLFFNGYSLENGQELWVTDGSAEGTYPVIDLSPGSKSYSPNCPTQTFSPPAEPLAGTLAERAKQTGPAERCVFYDLPNDAMPRSLTVFNDYLYFIANDGQLFRTDGTGRGIQEVGSADGSYDLFSSEITKLGEQLLVTGYSESSGRSQLWVFPR